MYKIFGTKSQITTSVKNEYNNKPVMMSYSSKSLKVNIYSIGDFTPQMEAFKLKDDHQHFLLVETSIENISDSTIAPSWFSVTYFIKDNKGKFTHGYLDRLTGYYQENRYFINDSIIKSYYSDSLAPHTALKRKLFFFPMDKDAKPVKIYFDDPLTKESHEFPFSKL